ncbi:MAG: NfeD family protein [Paludibacter sp.]
MKKTLICIYLTIVIITQCENAFAVSVPKLYVIDLKKDVGATTWLYIQRGFDEAYNINANAIVIHMNTYGGEVVYADSIRTKILNSKLPVYAFIDNNAASAGALIAIACDSIFMRSGASIGAATVVNQTGEKMPDKYQSYMRATMRATAESHGKDTVVLAGDTVLKWKRDPLIAEAMVDERTVVPGVVDSGKVLTFTALEAQKYNYCEKIVEDVNELVTKGLGFNNYEIVKFTASGWDNIKGFLMSSVIQGLLIMLIIGGIYFELQTPGIGFPLVVAITAAVLYFAPLYIDGLAANWEILLFLIGLVLIALELFVIPGFGIAGISGIVFVVVGLTLSLLNNVDFNFELVKPTAITNALATVVGGVFVGFGLVLYLSSKIGSKGVFRHLALKTSLDNKAGYIGVDMAATEIVGETGIATTVLRPSGKIKVAGVFYDAVSLDGFIEKGDEVRIVRYETGQVFVEKLLNTD